jgi:hypothetical protein
MDLCLVFLCFDGFSSNPKTLSGALPGFFVLRSQTIASPAPIRAAKAKNTLHVGSSFDFR